MLNKYLKCSVWRLALRYDIYMSLGFKRLIHLSGTFAHFIIITDVCLFALWMTKFRLATDEGTFLTNFYIQSRAHPENQGLSNEYTANTARTYSSSAYRIEDRKVYGNTLVPTRPHCLRITIQYPVITPTALTTKFNIYHHTHST